jgi:hypothetical protein
MWLVIIAARGMTLSSNFLSGLLETDAIALHCDERYCRLSRTGLSCGKVADHEQAIQDAGHQPD